MSTAWNLVGFVLNVSNYMKTLGITLSKAGSITSLICAIHCALTPLALLALPVMAAHSSGGLDVILGAFLAKTTEWVFLGVIGLLAGFGLLATLPCPSRCTTGVFVWLWSFAVDYLSPLVSTGKCR